MISAAPYIVLGIFATISLVLYIAGCAISKEWYPMFTIIPAILCCIFALILLPMLEDNYYTDGTCAVFTPDSTIFFLIFFIVSTIGLPCVFYHCGIIRGLCFGMTLGGDASVLIGFIIFVIVSKKTEGNL
jgi:hypothetical protein